MLALALAAAPARAQGTATDEAAAAGTGDLYRAHTIVTGTDMRSRPDGLALCLLLVLVKVSGDPSLQDDPAAAAFAARADTLLQDLVYLDRESDIPHHDEQGSRDRPQDLIARFDPRAVDAALAALGRAPWAGARPPLLVRVRIVNAGADTPLGADTDADERERRGLLAAADRYGMRVVLPTEAQNKQGIAPAVPGAVTLSGTLTWSDAALGWVGAWQMAWQGRPHEWGISGVSFDDAFRDAIRGAMAILSGHAAPG